MSIVAIDGSYMSGRRKTAFLLSHLLGGYRFIDSNKVYRFVGNRSQGSRGRALVYANSLSYEEVRRAGVDDAQSGKWAREISQWPEVRDAINNWFRSLMLGSRNYVVSGLAGAYELKPFACAYLDAEDVERARRRMEQLAAEGIAYDPDEVLKAIRVRDREDMTREVYPLRYDPTVYDRFINTTRLTIEQTAHQVLTICKHKQEEYESQASA